MVLGSRDCQAREGTEEAVTFGFCTQCACGESRTWDLKVRHIEYEKAVELATNAGWKLLKEWICPRCAGLREASKHSWKFLRLRYVG
jgi:hypothetical protein